MRLDKNCRINTLLSKLLICQFIMTSQSVDITYIDAKELYTSNNDQNSDIELSMMLNEESTPIDCGDEDDLQDVCMWHMGPVRGEPYSIPMMRKNTNGKKFKSAVDRDQFVRDGTFCSPRCALAYAMNKDTYEYKMAVSNIYLEQKQAGVKYVFPAPHWKLISRRSRKGIMSLREFEAISQSDCPPFRDGETPLFPVMVTNTINTYENEDEMRDTNLVQHVTFLST